MAILIESIRNAALSSRVAKASTITEARNRGLKTVFLCHSHDDKALVKGVVHLLEGSGWNVYIDWEDDSLPSIPDKETADKIKQKIKELDYFIFLATGNSMSSRWCPWEIGYADGVKAISRILILPVTDGNKVHGSEYLQLYQRIDKSDIGRLAVFGPNQNSGVYLDGL